MASEDDPTPLSLLLLPSPPSPPSSSALRVAYSQSLAYVLRSVAKLPSESRDASILDIGLPCVISSAQDRSARSSIYDQVQTLLARLYRLVSIICAEQTIEVEGPGGVDVRVFLIECPPDRPLDGDEKPSSSPSGPLISLPTLAQCDKPWTRVYSFGSEGGEAMLRSFKSLRARLLPGAESLDTVIVLGETEMMDDTGKSIASAPQAQRRSNRKHESVAVGGTFDHLHAGHKLLLTMTAFLLEPPSEAARQWRHDNTRRRTLTVGITGDELLRNKKFAEHMQSWNARMGGVLDFLVGILDFTPPDKGTMVWGDVPNTGGKVHRTGLLALHVDIICVQLSDPFGPTVTDEAISALVISAETRAGGAAVNEKRREKGWAELDVFEVDILDAGAEGDAESGAAKDDFASKISSTEIRRRISDMARVGDERSSKRPRI